MVNLDASRHHLSLYFTQNELTLVSAPLRAPQMTWAWLPTPLITSACSLGNKFLDSTRPYHLRVSKLHRNLVSPLLRIGPEL